MRKNSASRWRARSIDALQVEPAGEHEVIVATETEDDAGFDDPGVTNLFLLDLRTGSAQFVARIERGRGYSIPLSATEDHVLWAEGACMLDARIRIFDRATGEHTTVQDDLDIFDRRAYLAPGGRFAFGAIGQPALVDIETMEYAMALPDIEIDNEPGIGRAVWSADYRYASYRRGGPSGAGSLCPI